MDLPSCDVRIRHCPAGKSPSQKFPMRTRMQSQRRMADGGGHAAYLAVFAFNQFQPNPAIRHAFAETDGRVTRGNYGGASVLASRLVSSLASPSLRRAGDCPPYLRLRLQNPGAAGQRFPALNQTPRCNLSSASGVGIRSTCAQYSRSWAWRGCSSRSFHPARRSRAASPSESASSRPMG